MDGGQFLNSQLCKALLGTHTHIATTDLDHLLSIDDFEFLQVFFEELGPGSPFEQPQEADWREERDTENILNSAVLTTRPHLLWMLIQATAESLVLNSQNVSHLVPLNVS